MDDPLINLIVPIYNVEQYLSKCVDSILAQTYKNLRVILVDDGSPDGCPAMCDEYAQKDGRVMTIHRPNAGQSAARNSGLSDLLNCGLSVHKGDYVAFVDGDDYVAPDYIEFLYKLLRDSDADISQCGHYLVYSERRMLDKDPNHVTMTLDKHQAIESLCYNGVYDVTAWNKLYKLSIFDAIRYPEGRIYEDTAICYLIAEKAKRFVVNMTPKYYYIQRYNSTANSVVFNERKYQFIQAGDEMADYITERYPDLAKAANVKRVFVRLSTLSQMVNSGYNDKQRVSEIKHVVAKYRRDVLLDKKVSKRDKLGIISLALGFPFYRFAWKLYYKFKRRNK
ncbi:MAG: glycosyltransferase [Synergistaceae bacterium]|jgi:glycosyltransferase involved in cell wall biosynthesis|nr:glycosyltransferase [Synergistaceae bacterium]